MLKKTLKTEQLTLYSTLAEQLNENHPLYILANKIEWLRFEEDFKKTYHDRLGRPAKPIRLMTGLLILKHLRNLSDESVVEQFQENAYYQYFCGERSFVNRQPCDASELVHLLQQDW